MSNAWETTIDDVLNVAHKMGRKLTADEAEELFNALDQFEIENSALQGNDMETQTEYAYVEIRRQFDCLDEWKRIDAAKEGGEMKKAIIEQREQLQENLRCILDGMPDAALDAVCQSVVDSMNKLIAEQEKTAAQEPLTVKSWLRTGELTGEPKTQADIIEQCGRALDNNNCNDALGDVVFEATDGKHYVITVEAVIQEANAEYVKDILWENEEENEESTETICCEHCGHEYDRHIGDQCPNCGHLQEDADED